MKCLIIDDNELARAVFRQLVSSVPFLDLAGECADAFQTLAFLQNQQVDLLLLDVEMPGLSGLEFLKSLTVRPLTILITSKKDYAFEAFELNVVDYLVKPITLPRFLAAINHANEIFQLKNSTLQPQNDFIFVRTNGSLLKIAFAEILWVEAMGDYVTFQMDGKKHLIHSTLRQVEEKLSPSNFLRIHRSHIVALDKIEAVEDGNVVISKKSLPIAENYKAVLLTRLNLL